MSAAAAPVAERYVTRRELARLMGISLRTLDAFVAEGMPSETWGMSRTRRFLPSKCIAWAHERRLPPDRADSDRARVTESEGSSFDA
jgi:phage terminase Nu1 subunit (DNA packaging protein)